MDLSRAADTGTFPKCARNTDSGVWSSSVGTRGEGWQLYSTRKHNENHVKNSFYMNNEEKINTYQTLSNLTDEINLE